MKIMSEKAYDPESPTSKELLAKLENVEEKFSASADTFKSSLPVLTTHLTELSLTVTNGQEKLKAKLEALTSLPKILEMSCPRKEIDSKMLDIMEKLDSWQISHENYKTAFSEKIQLARSQKGEKGKIALNEAQGLNERYQSSTLYTQTQLKEEIKDYTKFVVEEKAKQEARIGKISKKVDELIEEVKTIEKELKAKDAEYNSMLEKELAYKGIPLDNSVPTVLYLDSNHNEWLACNTLSYDVKKVEIETKLPKYSHFVRVDDTIYLTGGIDVRSRVLPIGYKFDLNLDITKGVSIANMLYAKKCHTLVELDKYNIASIGGEGDISSLNKCEKYDIAKNVWEELPSLNQGRKYVTVTTFKDQDLYAFGGVIGRFSVPTIEKIALPLAKTSKWELVKITKDFPAIYSAGVYPLDECILIFGGNTEKVYTFDPISTKMSYTNKNLGTTCGFRGSTYVVSEEKIAIFGSNKQLLEISTEDFSCYFARSKGIEVSAIMNSVYNPAPYASRSITY